ncbi:MAG TPA: serine hydrolase domain-containing protein [Candidatus Eisenbacteria bacterium]
MSIQRRRAFGVMLLVSVFMTMPASESAGTQSGARAPRRERGAAIEALVQSSGDAPLDEFAATQLEPGYRASFEPGALRALLSAIRREAAGFGGIEGEPVEGNGLRLTFLRGDRGTAVVFRIQEAEPYLITHLELQGTNVSAPDRTAIPPITWDNLELRLAEEEGAGFSGVVYATRGGKVVLHRGYGMANRDTGRKNDINTVFAIGSIPIDFTRAAILKLDEMGTLHTSDLISKYFEGVPADKAAMTIDHLLNGTSGLPDFHHKAGVDADRDLAWIDRQTAIDRILAQPLLFAPGNGEQNSHSGWVLLATLVEIVSGKGYEAFLREHFFGPAGMTRTGNHESAADFLDDEFAVGYGGESVGKLNIPKYWGRTSWLVMGSGGMESTPGDLALWHAAIRERKTLGDAAAARYLEPGVFAGGDDRGFFCLYNQGGDDQVIVCCNAHAGPGDRASAVARALVMMAMPPRVSSSD